jgi:hypothetical protein
MWHVVAKVSGVLRGQVQCRPGKLYVDHIFSIKLSDMDEAFFIVHLAGPRAMLLRVPHREHDLARAVDVL